MSHDNNIMRLLSRFPKFERSYEKKIHNKVHITEAKYFMLIPKGQKVYLWFTYLDGNNVCLLIHMNSKSHKPQIRPICFDNVLSLGTLLFGTLICSNSKQVFSCENVIQYKGSYLNNLSFSSKLTIFKELFDNHISQVTYNKNFITVALPYICDNYHTAMNNITDFQYSVYGISCFGENNIGFFHTYQKNDKSVEVNLVIAATAKPDMYNVYCERSKYVGVASVPTYNCSVMLNKLLRNIKENENLDLLEESDDEDEFENVDECKFVHLNKSVIMKCIYNKKFRKWQPIGESNGVIVSYNELCRIENNYN